MRTSRHHAEQNFIGQKAATKFILVTRLVFILHSLLVLVLSLLMYGAIKAPRVRGCIPWHLNCQECLIA